MTRNEIAARELLKESKKATFANVIKYKAVWLFKVIFGDYMKYKIVWLIKVIFGAYMKYVELYDFEGLIWEEDAE